MKELFLIKDTVANKISYYHLMLFLVSLPFDRFFSHLILISFTLHTIIQFDKGAVKPVFTLRTLALQSVFFVTVLSTIYTINQPEAFREWGRDIPIFLIPLLFCFNALDLKKYRPQLLLAFALGGILTILYLYLDAFFTIRHYQLPLKNIFSHSFTNQNFTEPIDIHATFFSLQIAISLVYLLSLLIKERLTSNKMLYGICCLILAAGIVQLSSKSILAALFLIINIGFPYFLLPGAQRRRFIMISVSASALIVAVVFYSHNFRERYLTELKEDLSHATVGESAEPRLVRWEIAVNLIKNSPIIGYGAGSEIQLLQQRYFMKKFYRSYLNRLNSHNEYLSFTIKSGVWGLAVYLATLVYGFRKAIRKKDIVFFSFMMLVAIISLSENILDADKGVIFYSFFFPFFVFVSDQKEKLITPMQRHKNLRKVATKHEVVPSL
ncbi:MAG TPA: O-antigen ligase family protein [Mucilaginibacter sp.]|nr:O-antigen ligase family protein [Mucilaginibacter sp.]